MPYRFQLEALRKVREAHRDQERQRVADALTAERVLIEQAEAIAAELQAIETRQRAALVEGRLDVNDLLDRGRYEMSLRAQLDILKQQNEALEAETARRRDALRQADVEVRVLDKLDERRREEFDRQQRKQEAEHMAEWVLNHHTSRARQNR